MSLTIRKIMVLGLIGIIFLTANILVVANWISDTGIAEKAGWLRKEFLTGSAIAVIIALLILLVPKQAYSSFLDMPWRGDFFSAAGCPQPRMA